jgi:amino acid transporter
MPHVPEPTRSGATPPDDPTTRSRAESAISTATNGLDAPRRSLGRRALVFVSVGAVIGSGWLFSSFDAARIGGAGGAVTAWVLGISLVIVLAFVHAELGTMFPVDGGTARFPLYSFGRITGFFSGWFAWISAVCVPPIETEAALRYVGNYAPSLISQSADVVRLTPLGQLVAAFVLLGFTALNAAGMRSFRETNTVVVWWKIAIPVIVATAFIVHGFAPGNFTVGGLFPAGAHGVLAAISTGGVVFALLGFEQAVELGGESKHPQRSVPWAVIGSVVIAGGVYLVVQIAFIGATPHSALSGGWQHLRFHGEFGPLAGLAGVIGVTAIAYLIYADAIISPAGSGMTFSVTASRLPFALAREGYLPMWFGILSRRNVPFRSLVICYLTQLVVIILLPDWGSLLSFITAATVLVYATAPLALAVLRKTAPDLPRPYRLRFAGLTAPVAFVIANLLLVWVGWTTDSRLFLVLAFGALIVCIMAAVRPRFRHTGFEWLAASWIAPYAGAMCTVSYLSSYGSGHARLSDWASAVAVLLVSLAIYVLAVHLGTLSDRRLSGIDKPISRWYRVDMPAEDRQGQYL